MAATFADGKTLTAARGVSDMSTGAAMTSASLIPGGSVTKFTTALASLKLAEAGRLDLDQPVHVKLDPWLASQGHKSLLELWGGDKTIESVTMRQLLQMAGGIQDYDDFALQAWTLKHKTKDYLPIDFVTSVDKSFLFSPGHGGAYSGVSYVMAGWVLCAAVGCSDWTALDQGAIVEGGSDFKFSETTFMKRGPCSQYRGVVQQYYFGTQPSRAGLGVTHGLPEPLELAPKPAYDPDGRVGSSSAASATVGYPKHCTTPAKGTWFPKTLITGGTPAGESKISSGGAASCCAAGDAGGAAQYWTFESDSGTGGDSGTCKFWKDVYGHATSDNATSGATDAKLSPADFIDIYDYSCLNGWTMGNVAT